ncbi:MAG: MFS transporter [Alphaproteobacteria bacterium]|nr:MFS transporter [Alphaproteobacteria bacterium]
MKRVASRDEQLIGMAVFDAAWQPLYQAGAPASRPDPKDIETRGRLHPADPFVLVRDERFHIYAPIAAPTGGIAGWVEARYETTENEKRLGEIRLVLSILTVLLVGVATAVSYATAVRGSTRSQDATSLNEKAPPGTSRLGTVLTIATPVAMAILLAAIFILFDRNLLAAAENKARVLAALVGGELSRAYDLGVPVAELQGVDLLLDRTIQEHSEIAGIRLAASARDWKIEAGALGGRVLAEEAIKTPDDGALRLSLIADPGYVLSHLRAMSIDLMVVLFVAVFATREVILFGMGSAMAQAPPATDGLVGSTGLVDDIRFPIFLVFLGTEISRSFFPLFVADLYDPGLPFSRQIAIALPMSAWVLAMVLATPFAESLIRRFGIRRTLIFGMIPSAVGLCFTATAQGLWDLTVWRCLTAGGFGLVTVAAILHTTVHSKRSELTRSVGVFVAASVAASVCAAAIGGILADSIGQRPTFIVGGLILILAIFVTRANVRDGTDVGASEASGSSNWIGVLRDPVFMLFMILAAIPSRVVLTGLFYLLVPLTLNELGYEPSDIGRLMMVFFITMLVLIPVTGRLADQANAHRGVILAGAFVAAAGGGLLAFGQSLAGVPQHLVLVLSIIAIGAAQCTSRAPMIAYLGVGFPDSAARHGQASLLVAFRLLERVGSVAGPLVVAALSQAFGYEGAATMLAIWLLINALGVGALFLMNGGRPALGSS